MSAAGKYTVVHPVRFDGHLYQRGKEISLPEKVAFTLLGQGVITNGTPTVLVVTPGPNAAQSIAAINRLNKLTKDELKELALATHQLTFTGDETKEVLVGAIYDREVQAFTAEAAAARV